MTAITTLPAAPSRGRPTAFPAESSSFLNALPGWSTSLNTSGVESNTNTSLIAAAVASGAITPANYTGTSTTSLALGTGTRAFTTQTGKSWVAGQFVMARSGSLYMRGSVTSYAGGVLTLSVTEVFGTGTLATWNLALDIDAVPVVPTDGPLSTVGSTGGVALTYLRVQPSRSDRTGIAVDAATSGEGKWIGPLLINSLNTASLVLPDLAGCTTMSISNPSYLTELHLPALESVDTIGIASNSFITTLDLPALREVTTSLALSSCYSLTSLTLTNLKYVGYQLALSVTPANLNLPALLSAGILSFYSSPGTLTANALTNLGSLFVDSGGPTNVTLPALVEVAANISFNNTGASMTLNSLTVAGSLGAAYLVGFSVPALAVLRRDLYLGSLALTTVSLPALTDVGANLTLTTSTSTTSLSLAALINVGGILTVTSNTALTTFSLPTTLKKVVGNTICTGNALNQASIDNILVRLAGLNGTGGTTAYSSKTVTLTGGTNATPSATGLTAKSTLVGRGCTVTHN